MPDVYTMVAQDVFQDYLQDVVGHLMGISVAIFQHKWKLMAIVVKIVM